MQFVHFFFAVKPAPALNLKKMISPSWTTYSLPCCRYLPAAWGIIRIIWIRSLSVCVFCSAEKNWFWPVYMERSKARAYIFPATTLQIPALWPSWAAPIHEQGHSDQNQFWELVRSIYELTGRTGQIVSDLILQQKYLKTDHVQIFIK